MTAYIFYGALISFLIGVAVGTVYDCGWVVAVWLLVVATGWWVISKRQPDNASSAPLGLVALCVGCLALGLLRIDIAAQQFGQSELETSVDQTVELVGVVLKEPDIRENTTHLYVTVGEDTILVTTSRYTDVAYGDEVSVVGTLKKPESFVGELGRTFNYPAYLRARGVEYQVSFANVTRQQSLQGNAVIASLLDIKHWLMEGIESVLTEPQAGLSEGLLLGVKQALGDELETAFRTSGIIHIVVLSGYNVMLVVAGIMFVTSFFLRRQLRLVFGLAAIVCFALIVGLSATVVRASIMASLLLIAQSLGRTYDLGRSLLLAGTLMVLMNPYILLYDLGFQFSFMATLGLVLIAPTFETFVTDGLATIGLREFLIATIATQIAVLPLLLYYIGEVSVVAVVVNMLVLPVVPLAMLATFILGVVAHVSTLLTLPATLCAHIVLTYIIKVATVFASLPFASVAIPPFPVVGVFLMYACMGLVVVLMRSRLIQAGNSLRGWTIEEEEKAAGSQSEPAAQSETPLFFR